MKTWQNFSEENPRLAALGERLLFQQRIGKGFLATIRKDGAPRLHPVSLVLHHSHLYMLIPHCSPKCKDLLRDGRYALQACPLTWEGYEEFYISGSANAILDAATRLALIKDADIQAGEDEILFELMLDRVMHTTLVNEGTESEKPIHNKWRST